MTALHSLSAPLGENNGPNGAKNSLDEALKALCPDAWETQAKIFEVLTSRRNKLNIADTRTLTQEFTALFSSIVSLTKENQELKQRLGRTHIGPSASSRDEGVTDVAQEPRNYAEVARSRPKPRLVSRRIPCGRPLKRDPVLLVYPAKEDLVKDSEVTRSLVTSAAAPRKLGVQVKSVRAVRNGGIKITCQQKQDVTKLEKVLQANRDCKGRVEAVRPKLKRPRVVLYNVQHDLDVVALVDLIREQNGPLRSDEIKPLFKMQGNSNYCHWVLELSPPAFRRVMRKKSIFLGWNVLRVKEYIRETRCYKCCAYGHIARHCTNDVTCMRCAGNHDGKGCTNAKKCMNCEFANLVHGKKFETAHTACDKSCPSLRWELDNLRNRIDYG